MRAILTIIILAMLSTTSIATEKYERIDESRVKVETVKETVINISDLDKEIETLENDILYLQGILEGKIEKREKVDEALKAEVIGVDDFLIR